MVERYRLELREILDQFEADREERAEVECRHFFSGAAAYVDGRIFMSLSPAGLALKLPDAEREKLLSEGGAPLRYFPKAPVKKDYVVLPESIALDRSAVNALIAQAIAHAASPSRP